MNYGDLLWTEVPSAYSTFGGGSPQLGSAYASSSTVVDTPARGGGGGGKNNNGGAAWEAIGGVAKAVGSIFGPPPAAPEPAPAPEIDWTLPLIALGVVGLFLATKK